MAAKLKRIVDPVGHRLAAVKGIISEKTPGKRQDAGGREEAHPV
jgi:hypothetical protein